MGLTKENIVSGQEINPSQVTNAKKRRLRRKRLRAAKDSIKIPECNSTKTKDNIHFKSIFNFVPITPKAVLDNCNPSNIPEVSINDCIREVKLFKMSSKEVKSRDEVVAARKAKKLAKQKAQLKTTESKDNAPIKEEVKPPTVSEPLKEMVDNVNKDKTNPSKSTLTKPDKPSTPSNKKVESPKSKDEVDRAVGKNETIEIDKSKELIKAERAAKKAAKQAKKKTTDSSGDKDNENVEKVVKDKEDKNINEKLDKDLTINDVVTTLKDIVNVAKEVQAVTDKVIAIEFGAKKDEESAKSKAELKAERRAKQEAQRAAKQAAQQQKTEVKAEQTKKEVDKSTEEKLPKPKTLEKSKPKPQGMQKMNWFQHLYIEHDKESLKKMAINSNLHPAVIKLGVQLASHVVTGSNARCIALLDALKKMVRDFSLPARTEFARGLEAQLAASVGYLWAVRPPAASQTNALKHFRHQLTQLPNNVDEFDAKKQLQEEIDRYIREQIDMAGEAISIAVRNKISDNDNILTYGCSSLIERILCEAHAAGRRFRALVVGTRQRGAREMLRRLRAGGVRCSYADISALGHLMLNVNKVVVGAASLLANGAVLAPAGTLLLALAARARNVPLLVACETHKFADTVLTDSFVYNEIGDPDELIDKTDDNSPIKDWRSNPNLSLLNLTYDVTPSSLVTAVVTELAILPCTSAPVVLRFKLSEYGL